MEKDCDPKLSLRLCNGKSSSSDSMRSRRAQQPEQQQTTIIYNGTICVCDVTELQARAIICMARREMEERIMEKNNQKQGDSSTPSSHPYILEPLQLMNPDLSMKRSLQQFLQRRKSRLDASSPYNCAPP